ncbi:S1C family serine protease [Brevibacillus sp. H7]|uniref:S1C family serine protease n=1 Tax=Brevibacillus sp. H7 TaxID=3349138 RepID=UPI003B7E58F5
MKSRKWSSYTKNKYPVSSSLHPFNFFVPIVERVKDGVVSIVTEDTPHSHNIDQLIRSLISQEIPLPTERSFGSGFIFHPKGYILTSEHVVGKSKTILVKLCNGRVFEAKRVLSDPKRDYAVIKIDTDFKLQPLPLGRSSETKVGEWVISIGSPLGLENSVTAGIISAKNRRLQVARRTYEEIFQTDAAINPGNSGGPLINLNGEVVGLNAFIIQSSQCLGFAIGIDALKQQLEKFVFK